MNPLYSIRFGIGTTTVQKLRSSAIKRSGSERSTVNNQSFAKTAISLTDAETYRARLHTGAFSGRRLLFGGKTLLKATMRANATDET